MQQVTAEYVEQVCRANAMPPGYQYTVVIVSVTKRMLAADIPPEWRLQFLERLDHLVDGGSDRWLTAEMVAAIEPMCDRGHEIYSEAAKLDRGKPGKPGMLDALAKFFPAFAVLNPSLMAALELEPRHRGYYRPFAEATPHS